MTQLQKECLLASACFHGLLLAVLVATAAFRTEPPAITEQRVLTLISPSARIVDTPSVGGGAVPARVTLPAPQPASPAAPPAPPVAHSAPPQAAPPKPATPPRAAPTPPDTRPAIARSDAAPAPKLHQITPTYVPVAASNRTTSRNTDTSAQTRAAAQAAEKAAQAASQASARERAQEVANALKALESNIHGSETTDNVAALPGDGGGEAFVNYGTAICNVYYNAWRPEEPAHKLTPPAVKIVVSRNGHVTSAEFVAKSGDPLLDQSVQRALDAVKELPPFPPGSTDTERSFIIRFNPEAKQSAG